jgi:zinc transport system substrate-binding protein
MQLQIKIKKGRNMLKKLSVLLSAIILMLALGGCGAPQPAKPAAEAGKVKVSVSFDAMRQFVEAVGGDKVEVSVIIPDGTEPHEFEPKADDLSGLHEARVFVYNGLGMEPWADKAVQAADNDKLIAVKASEGVEPIKNKDAAEIEEHGADDPHCWLSLSAAKIEVTNIKDALVKADPDNKDYYEKNCADYVAKLDKLQQDYKAKFQAVPHKDFVTGHAAFAYFCRDFGLQQNSVEDVFAEGEPNAAQLSQLVDYCRMHQVHTIFAEDMASPEVSKTLAQEVKAEVKTIYTIESHEDDKDYLTRVQENMDKIYDSLQ